MNYCVTNLDYCWTTFQHIWPRAFGSFPRLSYLQRLPWKAFGGVCVSTRMQLCFFMRHRLMWQGGKLLVEEGLQHCETCWTDLADACLGVLRFSEFIDSRWLSFGRSLRPVIGAWCLGGAAVSTNPTRSGCAPVVFERLQKTDYPTARAISLISALASMVLRKL